MIDQIFDYALIYDESGYVNRAEDEMIYTEIPISFLVNMRIAGVRFLAEVIFKIGVQ